MSQKGLTLMPVTTAVVPREAPSVSIETVTDYRSFLDLKSTWNDLATAAGIDHPFLSFEWVQTWWECFGQGNALYVVVVKDRSGPIGIAPLMLSHGRMYGLRVRQLESIGNLHTRRFGFIIARAWREAYRAIWAHVREQRARWDVLRLCQLPEDSQTLAEVRSLAAADGYLTGTWRSDDSPYVSLAGTWETYAKGLDAKHRSNLRNRLKRLSGLGEVGLETVSAAEQVQVALSDGMRLEAAAWKGDAGTSINSQPEIRLFYTRFAERAARGGWLRLNFLTIDGCRIAFHYSVRCADKLYLLKPGYDPRYARYSPSNLLCYHVLQDGFQDGLVEYDFLGASDPWKLDWTKETRPHHWLYVFSDALRGRLLYHAKFHLIPRVKRMLSLDKR